MIHVDRSRVPPPPALVSGWRSERLSARTYYTVAESNRRQTHFQFRAYRSADVQNALADLFHGKCAFCESPGRTKAMHLRPEAGVVRTDGVLLPDHYWWLSGEWANLYAGCADCKRHLGADRGFRFPLEDEASRAPLEASPEDIAAELPLLLDPCVDLPEEHLVFRDDGRVYGETRRGQATIELLRLNRAVLVDERLRVASRIRRLTDAIRDGNISNVARRVRDLASMGAANEPFAGLARQLVAGAASTLPERWGELLANGGARSSDRRSRAIQDHGRFAQEQADFSLDRSADVSTYRFVPRYIERISIRNIKGIRDLELDLTRSRAEGGPWTVLLGENGAGKSTVLQAITLALIGEHAVRRLELDPHSFIHRAQGVSSGWVSVDLSGSTQRRTLRFRPEDFEFENAEEPQTLVLGYGETRLLPAAGLPQAKGYPWGRIEGLFRPARTLVDAEQWLLGVDDAMFDYVARAIGRLVGRESQQWLHRNRRAVWVTEHNRLISLGELSTGWQSVLATVIDILEVTARFWPTPESAEGVVLIDEIGAHLHPRWRMGVVRGLRRALPGMQFIVSTHEPLCLRGVEEHETVLLQRDERYYSVATTDLPSPRDLRVDQLLTSRYFGLESTLDPEMDATFDEYYQLLATPAEELTESQWERKRELADAVRGQGVLGHTRRDQLVYEAIDTFLAVERQAQLTGVGQSNLPTLKQQTLDRVRQLWDLARSGES